MIGRSIGPYQILAELGRGGMGEVYRARDTKLNRDVAIKILPEAFAADPDRLMRFTREAQTLASLNHPNIAHIHEMTSGVFSGPGVPEKTPDVIASALVMEFVEGEDLSARIARGPIPLEDAVPIARQVAEALEAAHEAGIIHRDLKPANIKVKADGTVKVLDFGLAKAMDSGSGIRDSGPGAPNPSNSPTMTSPALTAMGLILGTAAYMSPEQAKGRPVDRRADIWAFGVVLFEMLTGQRCFKGDDVSETLASVLKDRPPIDTLPASVPAPLRRLLGRCLDRDPRRRLRDMGEARIALEGLASEDAGSDEAGATATSPAPAPVRRSVPWLAASLMAGLALGWIGFATLGSSESAGASGRMMRVSVPAFAGLDEALNIAAAADDRFVVYQGEAGGKSMLYLHDFESGNVRPLAGTEAAENPFLSPDGLWVGFRRGTSLMKLRLSGGDAVRICLVPGNFPGALWMPDNTIVFPQGWLQGLSKVSADGGDVVPITTVNTAAGEKGHWWPRLLPDGRHVLFTIWNAGGGLIDSDVAVADLQTGQYRKLVRGADAWYLPPGNLVYYHAGSYQATTLDPVTLEAGKESVPVLEDATDPQPQGTTQLGVAISARGTLFYLTGQILPLTKFFTVAPARAPEPLPFAARALQSFSLSPDGEKLAAGSLESGVFRLHLLNLKNGIDERLDLPGSNWGAYWKHDSSGIAFVSLRKGDFDIYFKNLGGVTPDGPVRNTPTDEWALGWSADDSHFFFAETLPDGSQALKVRSERNTKDEQTILPAASIDGLTLSPDGRWMAYDDTRDGQENVYVRPYPGPGPEVRVSANGGERPAWSPDGTELYFAKQTTIVVVPFTTSQARFQPGAEQVLLTLPLMSHEETPLVVRARRNFIVAVREEAPVPPVLHVVLNWMPIKK